METGLPTLIYWRGGPLRAFGEDWPKKGSHGFGFRYLLLSSKCSYQTKPINARVFRNMKVFRDTLPNSVHVSLKIATEVLLWRPTQLHLTQDQMADLVINIKGHDHGRVL